MTFSFDMDLTITSWPNQIKEIMESLKQNGHEVYVLTGAIDPMYTHEDVRQQELAELGIFIGRHYDDILICHSDSDSGVASLKGKYCKDYSIDCHVDDKEEYLNAVKRISPDTLR